MVKNKILFIANGTNGSTYHRLMIPSIAFRMQGVNSDVFSSVDILKEIDLKDVFAVVVHRFAAVENMKMFKKQLHDRGIKFIVDLDDRWYVDGNLYRDFAVHYNSSRPMLIGGKVKYPSIPVMIRDSVKHADAVWVTSKHLKKRVCKEFLIKDDIVSVVHNGVIPSAEEWIAQPHINDGEPIFGYIAALGHYSDALPLKGLFDGRKLVTMQYDGDMDYSNYGELLGSEWKKLKTLPLDEYPKLYDQINVSIAPLANTDFNNCKSSLKVQEAGFKKRALMCSDIKLYTDIVEHNKTAIVCKNREDWEREIKAMTVQKAIDLGEALYERVKDEFNIFALNKLRLETILR